MMENDLNHLGVGSFITQFVCAGKKNYTQDKYQFKNGFAKQKSSIWCDQQNAEV